MTTENIRAIFDKFNQLVFKGELPPLPIVPSRARGFLAALKYEKKRNWWGTTTCGNARMFVSGEILKLKTESEVEDVVIHEMIHYYIMRKGLRDNSPHGPVFRRLMNEINDRFDRHITISHKLSAEETRRRCEEKQQKIRRHCFCVVRFRDSRLAVCVAAETRLSRFWKEIAASSEIESYSWYVSKNPFFNRYPHAVTLKFYLISPEELEEQLADALRLKRCGDEIKACKP